MLLEECPRILNFIWTYVCYKNTKHDLDDAILISQMTIEVKSGYLMLLKSEVNELNETMPFIVAFSLFVRKRYIEFFWISKKLSIFQMYIGKQWK